MRRDAARVWNDFLSNLGPSSWSVWIVRQEGSGREDMVKGGISLEQAEELVYKLQRFIRPGVTISLRESWRAD